jgi:hypothetical protein
MPELTPEQKRTVFYEGGLKETVMLAGRKVVLGELTLRDRHKIFDCMEGDLAQVEKVWREYVGKEKPGIARKVLRGLVTVFRKEVLGLDYKRKHAITTMKEYVEGLTANDIKLIQVCAEGRNEMSPEQIKDLVMDSPYSEAQGAVQKALEINGIDTKKLQAARLTAILSEAASTTMTSTAGSAELSNTQDGQGKR